LMRAEGEIAKLRAAAGEADCGSTRRRLRHDQGAGGSAGGLGQGNGLGNWPRSKMERGGLFSHGHGGRRNRGLRLR